MIPILLSVLAALALSGIAIFKGKVVSGVTGMLVPLVSLVAAVRLANPGSPWARRRCAAGSRKLARATARYGRHTRRYQRFQDRLAGAPTTPAGSAEGGPESHGGPAG